MDTEMKPASKFPLWLKRAAGGAACAALTGAAVWYDLTYNGGRLVYPMHLMPSEPRIFLCWRRLRWTSCMCCTWRT